MITKSNWKIYKGEQSLLCKMRNKQALGEVWYEYIRVGNTLSISFSDILTL